jgi:hypothetical protein
MNSNISAYAAWAAALVALTGVAFQFFVGRRQADAAHKSAEAALMNARSAGRYKIAEFRQAWIYKVVTALSELVAISQSINPLAVTAEENLFRAGQMQKLHALRTEVAILLNADESDAQKVLEAIDDIITEPAPNAVDDMIAIARPMLKHEWARLKKELGSEG